MGTGTVKGEAGASREGSGVRRQKVVHLLRIFQSTGSSTRERLPIRFGTYNIRNGRNGGLELALREISQASMDMGIFQETNFTDRIYTRGLAKYSVVATNAPSRHRGGVAVFYQPAPHFAVKVF